MGKKELKSFDDFTNLYEVQKTLRFELKPVWKTKDYIEINNVLEKDKLIDDNYHNIKYYFDLLHRKFINEALSKIKLDLKNYYKSFLAFDKKNDDAKKKLREEEEKLRKILVERFNQKANKWRDKKYSTIFKKKDREEDEEKNNGVKIFFGKNILEILQKVEFQEKPLEETKAPEIYFIDPQTGEQKNLFESFKGFTTYFANFNRSRENFYSEKDNDTGVANRIINENLAIFCRNKRQFDDLKKEYEKIDLIGDEKTIFDLDYYNSCLTQEGIRKYNEIIGRKAEKGSEGEKGLNQKINEYRQKTKEKLLFFKELRNQILSENNKNFREIEIIDDESAIWILKKFITINDKKIKESKKIFEEFIAATKKENQREYDLAKVYLKKAGINTISRKFFAANAQYFENALPHKETSSKEEKYKLDDFISIQEIKDALLGNQPELPKKWKYLGKIEMSPNDLFSNKYLNKENDRFNLANDDNWKTFLDVWNLEFNNLMNDENEKDKQKNKSYDYRRKELENEIIAKGKLDKDRVIRTEKVDSTETDITETSIIKMYADAALRIYQMMKYFALEKGRKPVLDFDGDGDFYKVFNEYYQNYSIIAYYNEIRNYLTKKDFLGRLSFPAFGRKGYREQKNPMSKRKTDGAEKIKLNFDISHDHDWGGLAFLLRKGEEYFIGVPVKGNKFNIEDIKWDNLSESDFKVMDYIQLKFKTLVGKGYLGRYGVKYANQKDDVAIANAKKIIKEKFILKYPLLKEILDKQYSSKKEFGADAVRILDESYCLNFVPVNESALMKANAAGKIYLFKIYSKDFSPKSKGKPNIQTQYFNLLFGNNKTIKLNSALELYFRPKKDDLPTKIKKGKKITEHKRYGMDKYFLHISIILNFGKDKIRNEAKAMIGYSRKFNAGINAMVLNNEDLKIIGIDRGENNLVYYSVIKQSGEIIDSGSLNDINMKDKDGKVIKTVPYLDLLKKKASGRDEARKNWRTIENIKEMKNGYISQVVRKICDLVLEYKAIVVFEDLNSGFKRVRSALDFPVYQKLELALIRKLNYLVNKEIREGCSGHYLSAYQLASKVANPQDIGKQTGIVFYTPAEYTSKTCPQCGFRKNNNKFYFETVDKAKEIIKQLKSFEYDDNSEFFVIEYNLNDFLNEEEKKKAEKAVKKDNALFADKKRKELFKIYSDVIRYRWHDIKTDRAKKEGAGEEKVKGSESSRGLVKKYDITDCLSRLFRDNGITYRKRGLKSNIVAMVFPSKDKEKKFYKDLLYYLNLILEIRNSCNQTDKKNKEIRRDYIQCPACGFHSDNPPKEIRFVGNGDANGAYNIARKGIMILDKIKQFADKNQNDLSKLKWGHLTISIEEWDKFVQR